MSAINAPQSPIADWEKVREEWLLRLAALVGSVNSWAQELGWSTRRIGVPLEDSQIGGYEAPGLLLQEGTARILLEPITRFAPGTEGVVDFYLMPAYDDIATLWFHDGEWRVSYLFSDAHSAPTRREAMSKPFTKEAFREICEVMKKHAA